MKDSKLFKYLIKPIFFILIGFLLLLTSCKNDDKTLNTPTNLYITNDEYLVWDEVPNATNYSIYVKKNDKTKVYDSSINTLDVFEIMDEEGKYEFNVLAYDDNLIYLDSNYSLTLNYEIKSQLDNLEFKLINNDYYELSIKNPTNIDGKLIIPSSYNGKRVDCSKQISFNQCDNMTSVIVPDTFTSSCLFMGCDKLCRVKLSNSCNVLREGTIFDCELMTEISLPEGVTKLQSEAIANCRSLKKVYIGPNLSELSYHNFIHCDNLDTIIIDENNITYNCIDNCILRIDDNAIVYGNKNSKIPSVSTKIENYAFSNSSELEMLTIPSQIKSIGTFAFSNCQDLKKVIIEEGIERIDNAFNNCESLEEITIPNSLKTIGKDFFSGLKSLKKINIENDNQTFLIDGNCFIRKDNYKLLFAMPNAIIPNYIKSIGFGAFSLTNLKEINIPDSVEEIDEGAFRNSNIEKIVLGSNLKMIGSNAFEYCSNLKKVVIYEGLEEIESYAFSNCYQLESVSLPTSLRKLGDYAFYNCLSSIVLPKTIEKVGNFAFHLCTIYTDFDPDGLREFKVKNRGSFGNFNNYHGFSMCSIFYCCDIEDGFVYSFTFYNYTIKEENGTRTYSSISPVSTLNGAIILEIPYREGWEFVGFTTIMGSNIIEYEPILVEGEFEVVTDFSSDTIIYTKKYYISFDFETKQKVDNNTILYSVWKKVD